MLETKKLNPILMAQYNAVLQLSTVESTDNVMKNFKQFDNVSNIAEAKSLFEELFPNQDGKQAFFIDGVEINIFIKEGLFRISADTPEEYFLYEYNI